MPGRLSLGYGLPFGEGGRRVDEVVMRFSGTVNLWRTVTRHRQITEGLVIGSEIDMRIEAVVTGIRYQVLDGKEGEPDTVRATYTLEFIGNPMNARVEVRAPNGAARIVDSD